MKYFPWLFLIISCLLFLGFGQYHLGQFETTDEHLWKYDRIGTYWEALSQKKWSATYINDKPGITVALIAGLGLLQEPHPEQQEHRDLSFNEAKIFEAYNTQQAIVINHTFRLPILLFNAGIGIILFFLIYLITRSYWAAAFTSLFVFLNPLLIGISQIINPDSLFWSGGFMAVLSYLAWLTTRQQSFILLSGITFGWALLSKYTGFILIPLFIILCVSSKIFVGKSSVPLTLKGLLQELFVLFAIIAIGALTFFVLLPAAFVQPALFFKGITQFLLLKHWPYWVAIATCLIIGIGLVWKYLTETRILMLQRSLQKHQQLWIRIVGYLFLCLTALLLINAWSHQALAPIEALRDAAYANEPQAFNFKPVLTKNTAWPIKWFELSLMEAAPLIFSLSPLVLVLMFVGLLGSRWFTFQALTRQIVFSVTTFILLYLTLTFNAGVVTNVRYLIILYPLTAFASALVLHDILAQWPLAFWNWQSVMLTAALLIVFSSTLILWHIRPFYFSYTNFLLPISQSIHDSWGHGFYEAAQYLNQLPEAEKLVIWSSSDTVCRFFVGKCLKSRHINLTTTLPDYFVFSKRGIIKERNQPLLENNPWPARDSSYYLRKVKTSPDWQLRILGRSDNFVNIVRFEKD